MPGRPPSTNFQAFLPRRVVAEIVRTGELPNKVRSPFNAVVLFADISGFSQLTERYARAGAEGPERLTRIINSYIGELIDLILAHRGDVAGFAGDAVMAVWPVNLGELPQSALLAAACSEVIRQKLVDLQVDDETCLTLKQALVSGSCNWLHVGSNRRACVLAGSGLGQLARANALAQSGEILIGSELSLALGPAARTESRESGLRSLLGLQAEQCPPPERIPRATLKDDGGLARYVLPTVAERLVAGQEAWLPEFRTVTSLFATLGAIDIENDEAAQCLQRVFDGAERILRAHGGQLVALETDDKGQILKAGFGLPGESHGDSPRRAALAGLELRELLDGAGLDGGIGIATGRAFCALTGNAARRSYTLHGRSVNLAARLMTKAKGAVYCDQRTASLAASGVRFEPVAELAMKGFAEPVPSYRPLEAQGDPGRGAGAVIFGREKELAALDGCLKRLVDGHSSLVICQGEPGMGKTTMVARFLSNARESGLPTLAGAGERVSRSSPLHAWRRIFVELLGGGDALGDVESARCAVDEQLRELPELVALAPLVSAVLPVQLAETQESQALSEEERGQRTHELLCEILARHAQGRGLVIALDDAHWIDAASWALVARAIQRIPRLCLLLAGRSLEMEPPEELKTLLDHPDAQKVQLQALEDAAIIAIAAERLAVDRIPKPIEQVLIERCAGHPLFAEQLALALRERGVIQVNKRFCRIVRPVTGDDADLPSSVEDVVSERIDGLPATQNLLVKVASVIGLHFSYWVLCNLLPIDSDPTQLSAALEGLVRADIFVDDSDAAGRNYRFKHTITRDVAYGVMPYAHRAELHARIAQEIESRHFDNLVPHLSVLTHHHRAAGNHAAALDYADRAGRLALAEGAFRDASDHFAITLDLFRELPDHQRRAEREIDLNISLGTALRPLHGWDDPRVDAAFSRARELCRHQERGNPRLAPALFGLWAARLTQMELEHVQSLADEYLVLARGLADRDTHLHAHLVMANTAFWLGDIPLSDRHIEKFESLYDPVMQRSHLAKYGHDMNGLVGMFKVLNAGLHGREEQAQLAAEELVRVAEELDHDFSLALALQGAAWSAWQLDDPATAAQHAERLVSLSEEHGFWFYRGIGLILRGWIRSQEGDFRAALSDVEEGYHRCVAANGGRVYHSVYRLVSAGIRELSGNDDTALRTLDEGLEFISRHQERVYEAELERRAGLILSRQGRPEGIVRLRRAAEIAQRQQQELFMSRTAVDLAAHGESETDQELAAALAIGKGGQGA